MSLAVADVSTDPADTSQRGRSAAWAIVLILGSFRLSRFAFVPPLAVETALSVLSVTALGDRLAGLAATAARGACRETFAAALAALGRPGTVDGQPRLFSQWLAAVGFVVAAGGVLASLDDPAVRREWLPVWALLWFLIPPPLAWDEDLIVWLQSLASRGSSLVLDVFGVRHLMEGNVLVLPEHRLLVEEACSGIYSLFTLLTFTALFVVAVRRPLRHAALLLASTVCWAWLMNIARVVS